MNYALPRHVGSRSSSTDPSAFATSAFNPLNMSRQADRHRAASAAPMTRILDKSRATAQHLVELATCPTGWKYVMEKQSTQTMVYELVGKDVPPNSSILEALSENGGHLTDFHAVKGVTTVHGDLNHVLQVLQTDTSDEFEALMQRVFGKQCTHGVVIDHLSCTTPPAQAQDDHGNYKSYQDDDAYTVHWMQFRPQTAMSAHENGKDFTFVAYQDAFERSPQHPKALVRHGRQALQHQSSTLIGVHAWTSLHFKDIPELPKVAFSDRLHFRMSGFVVERTNEPHVLRLSMVASLIPTTVTMQHPKRMHKWLQSIASCVGNLAAQIKPELVMTLVPKAKWTQRDYCYQCRKVFRAPFRRCHHCRFCGEAICHKCSKFVNLGAFAIIQTRDRHASSNTSEHHERRSSNSKSNRRDRTASNSSMASDTSDQKDTRGCSTCVDQLLQNLVLPSIDHHSRLSSFSSKSSISAPSYSDFASRSQSLVDLHETPPTSSSSSLDQRPSGHSTSSGSVPITRERSGGIIGDEYHQQYVRPPVSRSPPTTTTLSIQEEEEDRNGSFHFSLMQMPPPKAPQEPAPSLLNTRRRSSSSGRPPMHSRPVFQHMMLQQNAKNDMRMRNDMILLTEPTEPAPEFVEFSDCTRDSIFVRPNDGRDMIPLTL